MTYLDIVVWCRQPRLTRRSWRSRSRCWRTPWTRWNTSSCDPLPPPPPPPITTLPPSALSSTVSVYKVVSSEVPTSVFIYGRFAKTTDWWSSETRLNKAWVVSVSLFQFRQLNCAPIKELASLLMRLSQSRRFCNAPDRLSQSWISFVSTFVVAIIAACVWIQRSRWAQEDSHESCGQVGETAVKM